MSHALYNRLVFLTQCSKYQWKVYEPTFIYPYTQINNISQDISFKKHFLDQTEKLQTKLLLSKEMSWVLLSMWVCGQINVGSWNFYWCLEHCIKETSRLCNVCFEITYFVKKCFLIAKLRENSELLLKKNKPQVNFSTLYMKKTTQIYFIHWGI